MKFFADTLIMSNKYNKVELRSILDLPDDLSAEEENKIINRIYDELREVRIRIEVDEDLNVTINGAQSL